MGEAIVRAAAAGRKLLAGVVGRVYWYRDTAFRVPGRFLLFRVRASIANPVCEDANICSQGAHRVV